ncbi:WAT1-related protein At4g15540-like [Prosopis cineraria]|uniref:WAT1-related protein At4g15540-like n=1 Tax=Prosopis cineraria TaxID=364024 RepID=UPI00240F5F32|nr:WAT1-related protein At4g15540-like [Prosopis cineraria]
MTLRFRPPKKNHDPEMPKPFGGTGKGEETEVARMYFYKDVVPLCALIAIECINVGASILFKAATFNGVNYYVFTIYASAISTLVLLLPLPFILRRSTGLPPFKSSLLFWIFLPRLIGLGARLCGAKAIEYSSPTLSAAMSNLTPAFTFILAIFCRMEKVELRSSSTQAKIIGTVVSIVGALVVVLFRGPPLKSASSPSPTHPTSSQLNSASTQTKWVLGGFLLLVECLLVPIWYIVQTHVINEYPAKLIVVFLYNLCGTIISAPVCLIAEPDLSAWKIKPDITLLSIIYSGFLCTCLSRLIETWGLHLKGPVYVSTFKPLSIAMAAAMSVIFLGDVLHLGSAIGAAILSVGFYGVIWGKAKGEEELKEQCESGSSQSQPNCKTPLLQSYVDM